MDLYVIRMEKCLHAYDIVDLKSREYQRTHTKPRYLGDVDGRYRYRSRSCTPTLVGSLVNLELPETRANHPTYTANTIITNQTKQIQTTYEKTNRAATLDAWSYPPLGAETIEVSPPRPHTAGGVHEFNREPGRTTKLQLRPFSTGSPGQRVHPNTPPQLHSYMVAKIKRKRTNSGKSIGGSKNVALKTVTTALQQQWEEEDRKDQQTQSPRRVKSQNAKRYDSFAGQWLSFAGGGTTEDGRDGGVLEAFTGEAADEYYNVDARCGVNIANQLIKGNRIQVGKNGILQSNSLKVNQWKNEHPYDSTVSSAYYSSTDSMGRKKPPVQIVPLSWEDQLSKPDVKVLGMKEKDAPPPKSDLCERRPVVYEKLVKADNLPQNRVPVRRQQSLDNYKIKQRTKNKRNIDGTKSLNNRITMISVDQVRDDRDSMCSEDYEELLHRSLQTADIKDELDREEAGRNEDGVLGSRDEDTDQFASSMSSGRLAMSPEEELMPSIIGHQRSNRYQDDGFRSSSQGRGSPSRQMSFVSEVDFNVNSELPIQEESETPDNWRSQQLSPTSSPRQRSGGFPPRQLSARPAPSASSTVTSARTRTQQQVRPAPPKRAQSSPARRTSKPHYQFDEAPTPRNLHSPRPNLVKAGQLQRSGVASISSNQDVGGDHEYIKISHQIRPGSHLRNNRGHSALLGPPGGSDLSTSSHAGDNDPSDTVSVDSMDVNKGDHDHRTMDHDREECTCSPDVKRALSAALSHQSSHPTGTDPSGPVFYIPTADSAESDIFSGRAGGGGRGGGSVTSFYSDKSDPLDGYESDLGDSGRESPADPLFNPNPNPNEQKHLNAADLPAPNQGDDDQSGNTRELPDSSSPPLPGAASSDARDQQEVEFFINQIDGLSFNHADIEEINQMSVSRLNSAADDRKKRTVKFADEQESMSTSVPQCTPMSTPREHHSDSEMPS